MVTAEKMRDDSGIQYREYQRTKMQRDNILQMLRENGCRITKQRLILLDIILEGECSCCKEIYYKAVKQDSRIGTATVYRMVNTLEEMGAISRRNMYRVDCGENCVQEDACTIELSDNTVCHLDQENWEEVLRTGLRACGFVKNQGIRRVRITGA